MKVLEDNMGDFQSPLYQMNHALTFDIPLFYKISRLTW